MFFGNNFRPGVSQDNLSRPEIQVAHSINCLAILDLIHLDPLSYLAPERG